MLGWPIVVTPFAQYIVAQATLNLITGERYSRLSDEVIDLLMGDFGPMPGIVNQDLIDRALQTPRARSRGAPVEEPTLAELRQRFGQALSDEDLLLRAVMPADQVDAMIARRDRGESGGLAELMETLASGGQPYSLSISGTGADLSLAPRSQIGGQA